MRSETYYTFTLSHYTTTQSANSVNNQPMFTPNTQFIRMFKTIVYFFLGIGSCFGGLSLKYCSKSLMMYETERSYFLDRVSRKVFISSDVLKFKGTDLMSLLIHTM